MKMILKEKALFGFVTGDEIRPNDDDADNIKRDYRIKRDRAYSLIALVRERITVWFLY